MSRRLRVAVVGVGQLGQHHARLYAARPDVDLVAVVDTDPGRAAEVAARHGTRPLDALAPLLGAVEAVSVAVPTGAHHQVATTLLRAGAHVLVEKPLAPDLAQARDLVRQAGQTGRVLHVGHTERFNPAVQAVRPLVTRARFLEAQRLGTFTARSLDVDVVLDLMIHDLDVILSMVDAPLSQVDAVGVNALTDKIDIASVRLRFADGAAANLTASRISVGKTRKLRIFQPESYLSVDYAARTVQHYHLVRRATGPPAIERRDLAVADDEPLAREIDAFLQAARGGADGGVSGDEGCRALELALRIRAAIDAPPSPP